MKDFSHLVWPDNAAEAILQQRELQSRVSMQNAFSNIAGIKTVAGVDVSHDLSGTSHAAIVLMDMQSLTPIENIRLSLQTSFPYIPGLLSFREIPAILAGLSRLQALPDLLMVDGQGIAHPRRLGIAAHLGVLTGIPAIGVAKSRLTGRYEDPGRKKGSFSFLMDRNERLGTVLRSKENCLPLFISPGHRVDQEQALSITLHCLKKYRLPEPTRLADKLSKQKPPVLSDENSHVPQKV